MRVVHWCPNFHGGGGVATSVRNLAATQARTCGEAIVVTAPLEGRRLYGEVEQNGIEVVTWEPAWRVATAGLTFHGLSRRMRAQLAALRPDIVHMHAEFHPNHFWAPRLFDCPLILSPHGAIHSQVIAKSRRRGKRAYLQTAQRMLYRHLASFHAFSPFEAQQISTILHAARVYCLPQGSSFAGAPNGGRAAEWSSEDAPTFVFTGRLDVVHKGLDILVDSFARAIRRRPDATASLVIAGPDWAGGRAFLERRIAELGVDQSVRLVGEIDQKDAEAAVERAAAYIQTSRWEGFSLSVASALVAGTPTIVTDQTGVIGFPELAALPYVRVVPADEARVADAITDVLDNLDDLHAEAAATSPRARAFLSWERIARLHWDKYGEFLRAPARA